MAYESMHNVFVGMISFMTVGDVCVFVIVVWECKRYYWWIFQPGFTLFLTTFFHVSILYTKGNQRWNCTVFQPWCIDCSLLFFFVLLLPFGLIKNVDVTEKPFLWWKKKKLVWALKFSKIVEFKNLVWWFSVVFQCIWMNVCFYSPAILWVNINVDVMLLFLKCMRANTRCR